MIFGKIDFINLLPFHVFLKKHIQSSQIKKIIEYKKSYPSRINQKFKKREVDCAFISSIASRGKRKLNIGIIAKDEVQSVLVIPGTYEKDFQSETSNALAQVLDIKGKVIIGDKALQFYHQNSNKVFIDLAKQWQDKYNLPFVFATLCFNNNEKYIKKVTKRFKKHHIKIPQYILQKYSDKSNLTKKQILQYLEKIDYSIEKKEEKSLKLFLKLSKEKGIK
jgi:chorismate dehydratase